MIGVTRDGHVMTLEMQRAERRNALNCELVDGLREAVEKAAAEDIRAIVLTGQGTCSARAPTCPTPREWPTSCPTRPWH